MDDKTRWNEKYKKRLNNERKESGANDRLKYLSPYFNGGVAVDFAAGLGENSLFLARHGFEVQAFDISEIAVEHLSKKGEEEQLSIDAQVCDLTNLDRDLIRKDSADIAVIAYYLDRELIPFAMETVKTGGFFFMETFFLAPGKEEEGVAKKYKLEPGELLSLFKEWHILYFEENEHESRQTLFARKK
ncbi:class I SAM-dependent methyltransferase [Evansella clarkii]|jgi:2-polyprenyl-3-methyl-5-hydroxy-6-metoxy-1,4-benzoquinol methylase|uniref:class I SAM-dependent methyltransferase n=1 Tax=Evansella clarkii TaxID=79879 RepID=UPI000996050D|nr:methyltransferase domain-containing protein [Evansella clarkii]